MRTIEQPGDTRLLDYVDPARTRSCPARCAFPPSFRILLLTLVALAGLCFAPAARADITIFVISDTHYGFVADSTEQNQLRAVRALPGTPYPASIGGVVATPDAVFVLGDLVEEAASPVQFFTDYSGNGCTGGVPWPVYECDGNHDRQPVRDMIVQRHGDLLYNVDIGGVRFQSLSDLPSVASIATVSASLSALPAGTPVILFHHRPVSAPGGYISEWDPLAVDAYRGMLAGRNVIAIMFGHDHYSRHYVWEGYDTYTPGSVRQAPTTAYPESFVVIRITATTLSAASWIFGWDAVNNTLVWAGGKWGWTHQKTVALNTPVVAQ
jgi:predicted phosphodiesterase